MKIGVIICDKSKNRVGEKCFKDMQNRERGFEIYNKKEVFTNYDKQEKQEY